MNRKELYILAVIIFLTVIAWITFGIYHARTTSSVGDLKIENLVPLTPAFDNDIIDQLRFRKEI